MKKLGKRKIFEKISDLRTNLCKKKFCQTKLADFALIFAFRVNQASHFR
jgi:hypothetical protein